MAKDSVTKAIKILKPTVFLHVNEPIWEGHEQYPCGPSRSFKQPVPGHHGVGPLLLDGLTDLVKQQLRELHPGDIEVSVILWRLITPSDFLLRQT
jgi:hypothetical protein